MPLYLPIAELSLNVFLLIGLGAGVGFLTGMFGVGGGFLMTPMLIFIGVPPTVAVATGANLITASSVSGTLTHWQRGGVDPRMGGVLIAGGAIGAFGGAKIFAWLEATGQSELVISGLYVLFLGAIGLLMLYESLRSLLQARHGAPPPRRKPGHRVWVQALPFKMRFRKSRLYISVLLPVAVGAVVGLLAAILGIGGGFIMLPAMIYVLGMSGAVVVGTSLFQIIFVTAITTVLHAQNTQSVDIILTLILLVGAVFGAQWGARMGAKLKGEQLRALLALIVLGVCARMGWGLVATPRDLFSIVVGGG